MGLPKAPLFEDNSDLPYEAIINRVMGVDRGVVLNEHGDLTSAADVEMIDNKELSQPAATEGEQGRVRGYAP